MGPNIGINDLNDLRVMLTIKIDLVHTHTQMENEGEKKRKRASYRVRRNRVPSRSHYMARYIVSNHTQSVVHNRTQRLTACDSNIESTFDLQELLFRQANNKPDGGEDGSSLFHFKMLRLNTYMEYT